MKRPAFVSIDGPKGTGKTTLLHSVVEILPASLTVMALSEKDVDPYRKRTEELLRHHRGRMTRAVEQEIVYLLAAGRAAISKDVLASVAADLVLIDRWYPSDAYFRRCIPFSDVLATNIDEGVTKPDLILAAVCDPHESWRRATTRPRGFASKSGIDFDQHIAASRAFDAAIEGFGFTRLSTESPPSVVACRARDEILRKVVS